MISMSFTPRSLQSSLTFRPPVASIFAFCVCVEDTFDVKRKKFCVYVDAFLDIKYICVTLACAFVFLQV